MCIHSPFWVKILFLLITLVAVFPSSTNAQSNYLVYYQLINEMDSMLAQKDTVSALLRYEKITDIVDDIPSWTRHRKASRLYIAMGQKDKAKASITEAVVNGYMTEDYFYNSDERYQSIVNDFGIGFADSLSILNHFIFERVWNKDSTLLIQINAIHQADQALRRDKKYKKCRSYGFSHQVGLPVDSTANKDSLLDCYQEFRTRDSLVLQEFVDLVFELDYIPSEKELFGALPIHVLIIHLGHYDFGEALDMLLRRSVYSNKMSPRSYAQYIDSKQEYFNFPPKYFYLKSPSFFDDLSEEEIAKINKERQLIGLPICPNVIWSNSIY